MTRQMGNYMPNGAQNLPLVGGKDFKHEGLGPFWPFLGICALVPLFSHKSWDGKMII